MIDERNERPNAGVPGEWPGGIGADSFEAKIEVQAENGAAREYARPTRDRHRMNSRIDTPIQPSTHVRQS
jgi:hypothetical protein